MQTGRTMMLCSSEVSGRTSKKGKQYAAKGFGKPQSARFPAIRLGSLHPPESLGPVYGVDVNCADHRVDRS
eukprot:7497781-Pyramimonas_sp.AAC.1